MNSFGSVSLNRVMHSVILRTQPGLLLQDCLEVCIRTVNPLYIYIVLPYTHLVSHGFKSQDWSVMSGRSNAVLLADLVLFCCFVMSDWLEAVWVSDEQQRLNEWASGWPGSENRISHVHTHVHPHTQRRDTDVSYSKTKTQPSSHRPLSLHPPTIPVFYLALSQSHFLSHCFRLCANSFTVKMEGSSAQHSFI